MDSYFIANKKQKKLKKNIEPRLKIGYCKSISLRQAYGVQNLRTYPILVHWLYANTFII